MQKIKLSGKSTVTKSKIGNFTVYDDMQDDQPEQLMIDENGEVESETEKIKREQRERKRAQFVPTQETKTAPKQIEVKNKMPENFNELGKVQQVVELHKKGYSNKEIIDMGYNKSTVNNQVRNYKLSKNK